MSNTDPLKKIETTPSQDPRGTLQRGPLRNVILSATGQDVSHCNGCALCDGLIVEEMDLTIGEILQAATRNDNLALRNNTLWLFDELMEQGVQCQAGLDIISILIALQQEAELRGFQPDEQDEVE